MKQDLLNLEEIIIQKIINATASMEELSFQEEVASAKTSLHRIEEVTNILLYLLMCVQFVMMCLFATPTILIFNRHSTVIIF